MKKITFHPTDPHGEKRLYNYKVQENKIHKGSVIYDWQFQTRHIWFADKSLMEYLGVPALFQRAEMITAPLLKWKWGIRHIIQNEVIFQDGRDFGNDEFRYQLLKAQFLDILEFAAERRRIVR